MLSEYEVIRLKNIERNNQYLSALFLKDNISDIQIVAVPREKVKKSATKPIKKAIISLPTRQSSRLAALPIDSYEKKVVPKIGILTTASEEMNSMRDITGDLKKYSNTKFTDSELLGNDSGSRNDFCSSNNANYDKFLSRELLGLPIEEYGKAAVMKLSMPSPFNVNPRFNKYAGVAEFLNCLYLWVNISSSAASNNESYRYENSFLNNGRAMQWFGGSKMTAESRLARRLLSMDAVVLLFVRVDAGNYISLGRVRPRSCDVSLEPLAVTWELIDYEALRDSTHFQGVQHDVYINIL
jgi:hypothetical protein